jgi:hypothetical protein
MGAEFGDRKKTAHQGVRPGEVLAEIERKPQSWRQPIVVNRKDLITPPRHLDAANRRPSGVKRWRKHDRRHVVSSRLAAVQGDALVDCSDRTDCSWVPQILGSRD